ncbi:MAG: CPBP family intramembrane metalloprotease [Deltaproteobacteria bacterium]|nr:CPBP family intramembrane metalloprotease [Deltaproteobacteria bacterium]
MDRSKLPRRGGFELSAALLTAVVHVLPLERWLYPEIVEIVVIVCGWVGYLVYLVVKERHELAAMGFRREGLRESVLACALVLVVGTCVAAAIGASRGTLTISIHMVPLALLYPLWGFVQQWLVMGIVARRIEPVIGVVPTVLVTAVVFGAVHAPQTLLVVGTFVLGLALTPIYLRWRNLWPLGLVHGWLAIPTYFWIAGEDPWATVTAGP